MSHAACHVNSPCCDVSEGSDFTLTTLAEHLNIFVLLHSLCFDFKVCCAQLEACAVHIDQHALSSALCWFRLDPRERQKPGSRERRCQPGARHASVSALARPRASGQARRPRTGERLNRHTPGSDGRRFTESLMYSVFIESVVVSFSIKREIILKEEIC